jgi:hypothetical protein
MSQGCPSLGQGADAWLNDQKVKGKERPKRGQKNEVLERGYRNECPSKVVMTVQRKER